jgi:hypothetical protein
MPMIMLALSADANSHLKILDPLVAASDVLILGDKGNGLSYLEAVSGASGPPLRPQQNSMESISLK